MSLFKKPVNKTDILMKYFSNRFKRNKTSTIAITGSLGSGKSWTSISIAELWYKHHFKKDFPIENVCFTLEEIMKRFTSGDLKPGEFIVQEETGVSLNAKAFMTKLSRVYNYYMQSFRSQRVGIIFNLPLFSFMDKSTRLLINANFITQSIDNKKQVCIIKPLFHQINQQTGKCYPKYSRYKVIRNGYKFTTPLKRLEIPKPSQTLIDIYEKKKKEFVKKLGEEVLAEVQSSNNTKQKELTEFQEELWDYIQESPGLTCTELSKELSLNYHKVWENLGYMRRKNYNIDNFLRKSGLKGN